MANQIDFVLRNGLQVLNNAAIGSYAQVNAAPTNGLIVSGNVGVGTSSPQSVLNAYGTSGLILNLANSGWKTTAIKPIDEGGSYKGTLAFYTHPSSGTPTDPTERMRIDSSGNLLVGTNSSSTGFATGKNMILDGAGDASMVIQNAGTVSFGSYGSAAGGAITGAGTIGLRLFTGATSGTTSGGTYFLSPDGMAYDAKTGNRIPSQQFWDGNYNKDNLSFFLFIFIYIKKRFNFIHNILRVHSFQYHMLLINT